MGRNPEDAFFLVGISYKTAPVEIRERISFDGERAAALVTGLHALAGVSECVALSTCNRTEIYTVLEETGDAVRQRITGFLLDTAGAGPELLDYLYFREGTETVEHLFRVASGLDSMILGEPQILGQVRSAYSLSCDCQSTGPTVNRLFHHAFRVGKLARSSTSIGAGTVSVSFAAVELSKRVFGDLSGRSALLVGAGKTGELCARRLVDSGVGRLLIANRTADRANGLAGKLTGEAVPFDHMLEYAATADIVITSVTSREPVIRRDDLAPLLGRRNGSPLFLIDLGVPRNIEPSVANLENVHLYDIDDLEEVTLDNRDRRESEAGRAEEIVRREVEEFRMRLAEREVAPVIRELRDRCETIRRNELERVYGRVDAETLELLDLVTRRIVRKILHNPTVAVRSSESGEHRDRLLQSVQDLFIGKDDVEADDGDI